jgi:hypothetical protein
VVLRGGDEILEDPPDVGLLDADERRLEVGDIAGLQVDANLLGGLDRHQPGGLPLVVEGLDRRRRVGPSRQRGGRVRDPVCRQQVPNSGRVLGLAADDHAERSGAVVAVGEELVEVMRHPLLVHERHELGGQGRVERC